MKGGSYGRRSEGRRWLVLMTGDGIYRYMLTSTTGTKVAYLCAPRLVMCKSNQISWNAGEDR